MTRPFHPPVRVAYRLTMQKADTLEWCREASRG